MRRCNAARSPLCFVSTTNLVSVLALSPCKRLSQLAPRHIQHWQRSRRARIPSQRSQAGSRRRCQMCLASACRSRCLRTRTSRCLFAHTQARSRPCRNHSCIRSCPLCSSRPKCMHRHKGLDKSGRGVAARWPRWQRHVIAPSHTSEVAPYTNTLNICSVLTYTDTATGRNLQGTRLRSVHIRRPPVSAAAPQATTTTPTRARHVLAWLCHCVGAAIRPCSTKDGRALLRMLAERRADTQRCACDPVQPQVLRKLPCTQLRAPASWR